NGQHRRGGGDAGDQLAGNERGADARLLGDHEDVGVEQRGDEAGFVEELAELKPRVARGGDPLANGFRLAAVAVDAEAEGRRRLAQLFAELEQALLLADVAGVEKLDRLGDGTTNFDGMPGDRLFHRPVEEVR